MYVCMYASCTVTGVQYSIIVIIIIIFFWLDIAHTFWEPKQLHITSISWPAIKIYAASQLNFRLFSKLKLIEMCKMFNGKRRGGAGRVKERCRSGSNVFTDFLNGASNLRHKFQ